MAESDARIALTPAIDNINSGYEIILGALDNTVTYIRYLSENKTVHGVGSENILDSNNLKTMWVRFDNGLIEAGSGSDVGRHTVLTWTDARIPHEEVKAIAFSTGSIHQGRWEVNEYRGTFKYTRTICIIFIALP